MSGSWAGSGSRQNASTERPSGPGQFTAVERMVGISAPSWLMSTACLNPRWWSQPGSCGWNALVLRAYTAGSTPNSFFDGRAAGAEVPPLRFGRQQRILAIAIRPATQIDGGRQIGQELRPQVPRTARGPRSASRSNVSPDAATQTGSPPRATPATRRRGSSGRVARSRPSACAASGSVRGPQGASRRRPSGASRYSGSFRVAASTAAVTSAQNAAASSRRTWSAASKRLSSTR